MSEKEGFCFGTISIRVIDSVLDDIWLKCYDLMKSLEVKDPARGIMSFDARVLEGYGFEIDYIAVSQEKAHTFYGYLHYRAGRSGLAHSIGNRTYPLSDLQETVEQIKQVQTA